ncbi:hypothetical protein BDR05DRAFT_876856 [Suillus weaverae]|nr:hypothetical protein BDR05DRAFT_876856 [Suillus weaverae]
MEHILDSNFSIAIRELLAISPEVRKQFRNMTTNKHVTVGTVSINKLSGHFATDRWMSQYDNLCTRSDDGHIVADHFVPLCCICATTVGGCKLTCVLNQGAEVVVMPKEVWKSLSIGLRSDHRLNMESVNMSQDVTLGVIENILLNFGGGPMCFQIQVTECANFEILLGHPFFILTSCCTFDLPNGEQDILLTDPNMHKEM